MKCTVALQTPKRTRAWGTVNRLLFVILHVRSQCSCSVVASIANHTLVRLLMIVRFQMNFKMVARKVKENIFSY